MLFAIISYGPVSEDKERRHMALLLGIVASILTGAKLAWIYKGLGRGGTIDPLPWMIWGVLGIATLTPQIAEAGWQWTLLFSCANLVVNVVVVWFARRHPWGEFTRRDTIMIMVVAVGILVWVVSDNALFGLWFCLLADFVGVTRIWAKAWRDPDSERVVTWLLGAAAAACAVVSAAYAGQTIVLWYPIYVVGNALGSAAIVALRRHALERRVARHLWMPEAEK